MRQNPRLRHATRRPGAPLTRKVAAALAILVALAAGLAISGPASPAGAATAPAPNTDYASYPDGVIVQGCDADGSTILQNVSYTSGAQSNTDLRQLTLAAGDQVTMTWTGYAEGCDAQLISFAAKRAQHATFDPTDEQELIPGFAYCGGDTGVSCGSDGSFSLTLTIPSRTDACNLQIDAVIGAPLANVGIPPAGSFYGSELRNQYGGNEGPNMLIGASNFGGGDDCKAPTPSYSCAVGGIGVHLINAQTYDQVVRIYNGAAQQTQLTVPHDGTADYTVPVAEGATFDIIVKLYDSNLYTIDEFNNSGNPRDCEHPEVPSAVPTCSGASGTIDITLDNSGSEVPVTFVVNVSGPNDGPQVDALPTNTDNEVTVPAGATQVASVATGNGWFVVNVTDKATGDVLMNEDVLMPCTVPTGATVPSCSAGGAIVHLDYPGVPGVDPVDLPTRTFTVTKDGVQFGDPITLTAGTSKNVIVPISPGGSAVIAAYEGETLLAQTTVNDACEHPVPTVTIACAAAGEQLTVTNPSNGLATTITVKDGSSTQTFDLAPGASKTVTLGIAEDTTGHVTVTSGSATLFDADVARNCSEVEGTQEVPPTAVQATALPRTGSDVGPMVLFAGLLLALGGALLAASNLSRLQLAFADRRKRK